MRDYQELCEEYKATGYENMEKDEIEYYVRVTTELELNAKHAEESLESMRQRHYEGVVKAAREMIEAQDEFERVLGIVKGAGSGIQDQEA